MKEYYVTFEQAKRLNELGFAERTDKYYCTRNFVFSNSFAVGELVDKWIIREVYPSRGISAPRLDQAQKWLREEKGVDIEIQLWSNTKEGKEYRPCIGCMGWGRLKQEYGLIALEPHPSYEEALSHAIDAIMELL